MTPSSAAAPAPARRSVALDVARLLGLVSIAATHTFGRSDWTSWLFSFVVMYLFLTGYLWSKKRDFRGEVQRRTASLLTPYACWLAILLVAVEIRAIIEDGAPDLFAAGKALYGGTVAIRPFTTFYFFTVLVFSALLTRVLMRLPFAVRVVVPVTGLAAAAFIGPELAKTPLSIGSAWPCCAFVLAGIVFKNYRARIGRPLLVGSIGILVGMTGFALQLHGHTSFKSGDYGTPFVAAALALAVCIGLILVIEAVEDGVPARVAAALSIAAANSLVVVLLHPSVLWVLDARPENATILTYVVVLTVPTVLTIGLARYSWADPLLGKSSWESLVAQVTRLLPRRRRPVAEVPQQPTGPAVPAVPAVPAEQLPSLAPETP